jgi:hypothetical protein
VPHRAPRLRLPLAARRLSLRILALLAISTIVGGPLALTTSAAGALTMNARLLLQGHARAGTWAAVAVDLQNDGPAIQGELRMDGGAQSNARYAMAVDLATGSRKTYILHAQPPSFGRTVKVDLVASGRVVDSVSVAYLVHDPTQLVVGVLAERPQALISEIDLPPNPMGAQAAIVPLNVADLPERAEGWSVLDRLVWQDVDSNQLSSQQLDALRNWLAGGGRLVIVGGSAGIGTLSAFPDGLLPYRPTATLDLDPTALVSLLGPLPAGATSLPAMAGALTAGRALATSGDRAIAAELTYGTGRVTLLGFDPTTKWLAESKSTQSLWRALLPARTNDGARLFDDTQLVQSVYQLPSLALPPTSGLLVLIGAYIVIIGPLNYFILKRIDRRELAWVTMPLLVLAFTAASFGYGFLLRGTDVVVNEVAVVRGAPDATEATAQVYFGVFSPTRATYQVSVPQGALLAAPINGDVFGQGSSGTLDIVQGTGPQLPSMVRNLSVGTSSLRVVRAELPVEAPRMKASLTLENDILKGTFENASDDKLESVAIVLGSAVATLGDINAHEKVSVSLAVRDNVFGAPLADRIVGSGFDQTSEAGVRRTIRYGMVNQLTFDPMGGFSGGGLSADQAVILAFGRSNLLDVELDSQQPRRSANVLYYVPVGIDIHGEVTFSSDLLRTAVIEGDNVFSKERAFLNMGLGHAILSYTPIPFEGTFTVSQIRLALGNGGNPALAGGAEIEPLPSIPVACTDVAHTTPAGCEAPRNDFLPEVEVFDRTGEGAWVRLPRLTAEASYTLADPTRYVDPSTGQVLMRFVNESLDPGSSVGFSFQLALVGNVE